VPSGSGEVEPSSKGSGETGSTPVGSGEAEPDPQQSGEVALAPHLGLILGRRCPFRQRAVDGRASAWLGQAAQLGELIRG
jgi:hypothetical protein